MSLFPLPHTPPPPRPPSPKIGVPLAHIFALRAMIGPLPAELKFRENTVGSANFHCMQMSLLISMRFIFGNNVSITFP